MMTLALNKRTARIAEKSRDRLQINGSLLLVACMFILGTVLALTCGIPVRSVMKNYAYDVLVILIVMELFTNLIAETGIMQFLAVKIAELSKGKKKLCLILFGTMMFLISSCLNNVTAVLMILGVVFVLLKALEAEREYVSCFFAVILALSNTGGASSGVGDLPAVLLMTSGITDFFNYTIRAFPFFALTSVVLLALWSNRVKPESADDTLRMLAVKNLKSQYRNAEVRCDNIKSLGIVLVSMFVAWCVVPQEILPPEIVAILGYAAGMLISSMRGVKVAQMMDLKSVLTIASFLFFAEVISQTGVLSMLALFLQNNIADTKLLIMAIMVITSLVAGICSAGPAAAAMMPVVVNLCNGPMGAQADWIAVAYAASICAGSSLFMWSATAGFVLSGKINSAGIEDERGKRMLWGVGQYLKYGVVNYLVQLSIALLVMYFVL